MPEQNIAQQVHGPSLAFLRLGIRKMDSSSILGNAVRLRAQAAGGRTSRCR